MTVRSKGLPAWDSLNADQKRLYARMMEVFAGYAAQCDYELGRVVDACKELPDADNTLILYIAGDRPTFVCNFLSIDRPTITGKEALPKGKTQLVVDFTDDGGGMGKGGKITMSANGKRSPKDG